MSRASFMLTISMLSVVILLPWLPTFAAERPLQVFAIRNADSDSIVKILREIFHDQDVVLISDARTNTIIVEADLAPLRQVRQVVLQLERLGVGRPVGHVRRFNRQARRKPNFDVQVRYDGSVEIRAPTDAEYRVRKSLVHNRKHVNEGDPLMLLEVTNKQTQSLLQQEIACLRKHLAKAEALSRQHRNGRTDFDKRTFATVAKRATAIRAGISEKTRQLHKVRAMEGTFAVAAELSGVITFAQTREEYCPDGQPLEPRQLLVRITPD